MDAKQLGCQHPKCVCDKFEEFRRSGEIVRRLGDQSVIRKSNVDNTEMRRTAEDKIQSRLKSARVPNGRYGVEFGDTRKKEVYEHGWGGLSDPRDRTVEIYKKNGK